MTEQVDVDDWAAVNAARDAEIAAAAAISQANDQTVGIKSSQVHSGTPITFKAAVTAVCTEQAINENIKSKIVYSDFRQASFWRKFKHALHLDQSISQSNKQLYQERDEIFGSACLSFDWSNISHERVIFTLYKSFTGDQLSPARFGSHWEMLGFQANDPSTDLRGAGLLGLLQLLALVESYPDVALKVYRLANHSEQHFPLAIVSFQFTAVVLLMLRQHRLMGESARQKSMWQAVNQFHSALIYRFYILWKAGSHTIKDFASIKQQVQDEAINDRKTLMERFKVSYSIQNKSTFNQSINSI